MGPDVLRRKLQKKLKHKPYRKCPQCGERMECRLVRDDRDDWHLFKYCGDFRQGRIGQPDFFCLPAAQGCGYFCELFWSGGGTGRHIPHGSNPGRGKG